jgi:hypothetical protein
MNGPLEGVKVGDWIAILPPNARDRDCLFKQITSITPSGLIVAGRYKFRVDGRFWPWSKAKFTARTLALSELERCRTEAEEVARRRKERDAYANRPEVQLTRELLNYSIDIWTKLGLPKLKEIRAALDKASKS